MKINKLREKIEDKMLSERMLKIIFTTLIIFTLALIIYRTVDEGKKKEIEEDYIIEMNEQIEEE